MLDLSDVRFAEELDARGFDMIAWENGSSEMSAMVDEVALYLLNEDKNNN